jgi:sugar phosphate isomerase/epimerase
VPFSYVLPNPAGYGRWDDFLSDLACVKQAGYDAGELQIPDPTEFDEVRVFRALEAVDLPLCALQTGGTYASRGNCLCTADETVRRRTIALLKSFVELAVRSGSLLVLGLLQGRLCDEPDRAVGAARVRNAVREVGELASQRGVTLAFEPLQHAESGFHNTIGEVAQVIRELNLPGVRILVDTFQMNIEERDMLAPLPPIRDLLAHVHLCETNRNVLGTAHWPTVSFLRQLQAIGYRGYCSIGIYNTTFPRQECITRSMAVLRKCCAEAGI